MHVDIYTFLLLTCWLTYFRSISMILAQITNDMLQLVLRNMIIIYVCTWPSIASKLVMIKFPCYLADRNLWLHGVPTAPFLHLVAAFCLLLPRTLMDATLISAGFLPRGECFLIVVVTLTFRGVCKLPTFDLALCIPHLLLTLFSFAPIFPSTLSNNYLLPHQPLPSHPLPHEYPDTTPVHHQCTLDSDAFNSSKLLLPLCRRQLEVI